MKSVQRVIINAAITGCVINPIPRICRFQNQRLWIASGGHERIGLEDNIYYDRAKTELADNVQFIRRLLRIAREMGREPAEAAEARRMIGLLPRPASV